jgi:hypothetical protein
VAGFGVDRGSGSSSGNPDSPIAEALIDAKGDLIAGTADNTAARLAVGADETRLVADSAQSTGLKWVADTVNYLIAAAGDLIYGTAADTAARLALGAAKRRLAVNSGATAPEWVADTQNTVADTKGDLLVATADDTIAALPVGTDNQVPIADSTQSTGIRWGDAPTNTSPHRQTQLAGAISSGYNNTLSAGAGLNFNVAATTTNAIYSFANGFNAAGANDTVTVLAADASNQGSLNASNTHYIHATRVSASAVTWGQALIPPQYGYTFDRARGALLNFEAADASTTMTDDFGNTWTANGNAQIDTAQSKFGTASLLLDGTGDYVESSNYTSLGEDSWEMSCWFMANATSGIHAIMSMENAAGFGACVYLNHNSGTRKVRVSISSDGTTDGVVADVDGTTTISLSTWYRVRLVFDALAGTYRLYLSNNGAAEVQDQTTSSTARVSAVTKGRLGTNAQAGTVAFNGWLDAFRFIRAATVTTTETPGASAPAITDYPVHFFSIPAMTMYSASAASASAGVDPTLTQTNRVFVGECDTNGSSVTATRNYALRGEYVSALYGLALSTAYTNSHSLGVRPQQATTNLVNQTTESGYLPGDEVFGFGAHASNNDSRGFTSAAVGRNTLNTSTAATAISIVPKAGGGVVSITVGNWKLRSYVKRGW